MTTAVETELWETTSASTVYVEVDDLRGGTKMLKAGGKPGAKLRLAKRDREWAEQYAYDPKFCPFRNGLLAPVTVDEDVRESHTSAISVDALLAIFNKTGNAFQAAVRKIAEGGEVNVRRLLQAAESQEDLAKASQFKFLREYVDENYSVSAEQPSFALIEGEFSGI